MKLKNNLSFIKVSLLLASLLAVSFLFNVFIFVEAQMSSGSPIFNVSGWAWSNMASGSPPLYDHDPTIGWVVFSCNTKIKTASDTEEQIKICSDGLDKGKLCNSNPAGDIPTVRCRQSANPLIYDDNLCKNACEVSSFGVDINTSTGCISGNAWSSNVGWITFDRNKVLESTDMPPFDYDPARHSCPDSLAKLETTTTLNVTTTRILGWARAVSAVWRNPKLNKLETFPNSGGWDGWLSFNKVTGTIDYNVYIDENGDFHGWAWSDKVIGWLSFNSSDSGSSKSYKVSLASSTISRNFAITLSATPNPVYVNNTTTFSYTTSSLNCNMQSVSFTAPCLLTNNITSCNYAPSTIGNFSYYIAATATCVGNVTFYATSGMTLVVASAPPPYVPPTTTLIVQSSPSGIEIEGKITPYDIQSNSAITRSFDAPTSVSLSSVDYDFKHWENCDVVINTTTCSVSVATGAVKTITAHYDMRTTPPPTTVSTTFKIVTGGCNGEIATTSHLSEYIDRGIAGTAGGQYLSQFNTYLRINSYSEFLNSSDNNKIQCPYIVFNNPRSTIKFFIDVKNINTSTTYDINIKNVDTGVDNTLLTGVTFTRPEELKYLTIDVEGGVQNLQGRHIISLLDASTNIVVASSSLNIYKLYEYLNSCILETTLNTTVVNKNLCNFWLEGSGQITPQ